MVFTFIVCIHHLEVVSFLKHGYLAVEFFFVLSGFLLYQSLENRRMSPTEYLTSRLKKFYPEYFFAMIVYIFYLVITAGCCDYQLLKNIFLSSISEVFLIQNMGIWGGGNNYPLWYLSILVWGGFLVYSLLYKYEYIMVHFLIPTFVLGVYTYIFRSYETIEVWETIGVFSAPLLRGMADIGIGIWVYKIYGKCRIILKKRIRELAGFTMAAVSGIGIAICMIADGTYDMYVLLLYPMLLLGGLLTVELPMHTMLQKLSIVTYAIYLNHALIIGIFTREFQIPSGYLMKMCYILVFIIVVCLYSGITHRVVMNGTKIIKNKLKRHVLS